MNFSSLQLQAAEVQPVPRGVRGVREAGDGAEPGSHDGDARRGHEGNFESVLAGNSKWK